MKKCLVSVIKFECVIQFAYVFPHTALRRHFAVYHLTNLLVVNVCYHPSAASHEAQPSSTRFYYVFIKINSRETRIFKFILYKIPKFYYFEYYMVWFYTKYYGSAFKSMTYHYYLIFKISYVTLKKTLPLMSILTCSHFFLQRSQWME